MALLNTFANTITNFAYLPAGAHPVAMAETPNAQHLYVINQGGTLKDHLFLNLAIGAAYTPLSMDGTGKIYTQNDGHLFVVGN